MKSSSKNTHCGAVISFHDPAQGGREHTTITGTRSLPVGVRGRYVVGGLSGEREHLAIGIWAILVLNLDLALTSSAGNTIKIASGNAVERVAGGTNLVVDPGTLSKYWRGIEMLRVHRNESESHLPGMVDRVHPTAVGLEMLDGTGILEFA